MRPIIVSVATVLIALLTSCASPVSTTLDAEPSTSERSYALDCRYQAARQAEMRYPRQPLDDPGLGTRRPAAVPDDPAKGEVAQRFFNQCMAQKARLMPSLPSSARIP